MNLPNFQPNTQSQIKQKKIEMVNLETNVSKMFFYKSYDTNVWNNEKL